MIENRSHLQPPALARKVTSPVQERIQDTASTNNAYMKLSTNNLVVDLTGTANGAVGRAP